MTSCTVLLRRCDAVENVRQCGVAGAERQWGASIDMLVEINAGQDR